MLEDVNGEPAKSSFFLLYEKVGVHLFFYKRDILLIQLIFYAIIFA